MAMGQSAGISFSGCHMYTEYACWAVTVLIPVKFRTTHCTSRPEVGSTTRIVVYGSRGLFQPSLVI